MSRKVSYWRKYSPWVSAVVSLHSIDICSCLFMVGAGVASLGAQSPLEIHPSHAIEKQWFGPGDEWRRDWWSSVVSKRVVLTWQTNYAPSSESLLLVGWVHFVLPRTVSLLFNPKASGYCRLRSTLGQCQTVSINTKNVALFTDAKRTHDNMRDKRANIKSNAVRYCRIKNTGIHPLNHW